jgi:hypothetical protein
VFPGAVHMPDWSWEYIFINFPKIMMEGGPGFKAKNEKW